MDAMPDASVPPPPTTMFLPKIRCAESRKPARNALSSRARNARKIPSADGRGALVESMVRVVTSFPVLSVVVVETMLTPALSMTRTLYDRDDPIAMAKGGPPRIEMADPSARPNGGTDLMNVLVESIGSAFTFS
jgi:hypothetical protein